MKTTTHQHGQALQDFDKDIGEVCQWSGTTYDNTGPLPRLKICGKPTIGKGIFCDPSHSYCRTFDICERHKGTAPWYSENDEYGWMF